MKQSLVLLCLLTAMAHRGYAGTPDNDRKGQLFIYWGWNRSGYTTSNLRMSGNDYDFVIHKMMASDRQSPLGLVYLNPGTMTIPQYNYRIGYFIKDTWSLSIGMDHMKYVMRQDQEARLSGNISHPDAIYQGQLNGTYKLSPDFLTFEHTDGLNNLNVEARHHRTVLRWDLFGAGRSIDLEVMGGAGVGMMIPRTNTQLFMQKRYDQFHVSGFDVHGIAGIRISILKHFFIASEFKAGYINMPSIRTTYNTEDKASQAFGYMQYNILFGAQVAFRK